MRKHIIRVALGLLSTLALLGAATVPAQAATADSKICAYWSSYTYIKAKDIVTGASNNLTPYDDNGDLIGECTTYHNASNWRVDTDPTGASHSYRIRYDLQRSAGDYDIGDWHSCHAGSDNHSSDPQDPPSGGSNWRVVYKNYDGGSC